ncbi:hypothetical protein IGB42_03186 [Andreprevotia sp. IGB-42]|uniref:VanZ family protein n=1 Tax=Andreprevotia sp. IGB-42 TaxID=2497473 RepID=UPI00157F334A|nr:VanZ family protein [Andreprevotia sp. IGB-42]KAF0812198.1 hypothetical protein IGB42_03186 [Andreprevotia sp. IGB-42]
MQDIPGKMAKFHALIPWRWLFGICLCCVLVLALIPSTASPSTGWDKSNHLLAFAVLTFLARRAWPGRTWPVLLGLVAFGGLIEILQAFTPDRSADWDDLLADSISIAAMWLIDMALMRALALLRKYRPA